MSDTSAVDCMIRERRKHMAIGAAAGLVIGGLSVAGLSVFGLATTEHAGVTYITGWFICAPFLMWPTWKIFQTVKLRYREDWVQLGSPRLISNFTKKQALGSESLFERAEYIGIQDRELAKLCLRRRFVQGLFVCYSLVMFTCIIHLIVAGWQPS